MKKGFIFVSTIKVINKMTYTNSQLETIAKQNNLQTKVVIPNQFEEVEYLVINLGNFTSAYFLMDNTTFNYTYSHTYNATNDKITNKLPKIF